MVHSRYGLTKLRTAEVRRGCIFNEPLNDPADVLKNGGVIGSGAKFVSPTEGFKFSGAAGARISYGDVLRNPMTAVTFVAWFKCDNSVATRMTILGQEYNVTYSLFITNGILSFGRSGLATISSVATYNDGLWHQAVATYLSGVGFKIYVDGALKASSGVVSGNLVPFSTDDELTVGSAWNGTSGAFYFKGSIRNCMVFNTALDADEISAYYTGTMFRYDDYCVCDLPFDIAHHDTVNKRSLDVSGYNNHATWGDGSTSTTFPTKLAGRGYSFDGGDYMRTPVIPTAVMSAYIIWSSNISPTGTKSLFGSTDGGSPAKIFELDQSGSAGQFKFYPRGTSLDTVSLVGREIQSFMCQTSGATNKVVVNGQRVYTGSLITNNLNDLGIALGAKNISGVYSAHIVGNIYSFRIFSNYALNTLQAMDLDIRAKECLSKC